MNSVSDGLSRDGAEAAWRSVTPFIAATPHVRVSRDGGRTFPCRHARPLSADSPPQPSTVAVYDPASGTGRMLALDLDPARAGRDVHGAAVGYHHERHAVPAVAAQAEAIAALVARCGGPVLADVAPSAGRHIYILFGAALPWRELRDVCKAIALRFPAVDPAPMCSSAARSPRPGAATSPEAGGCSLYHWLTPSPPSRTRTHPRC